MELTVVVYQERQEFWSEISELPGCFASGRTLDELREALAEAIGLYLWDVAIELPELVLPVGESTLEVTPPPGVGSPPPQPPGVGSPRPQPPGVGSPPGGQTGGPST